jgi:predicted SnoaL-like aldol condensation-catalyzing enzyme
LQFHRVGQSCGTFVKHQHSTDPAAALQALGGAKVILITASGGKTVAATFKGLRPGGVAIYVGVGPEPIEVTSMDLIFWCRKLEGALTGDPATGDATLRFSALSGVSAMIETAPLSQAPAAYAKMMAGKARLHGPGHRERYWSECTAEVSGALTALKRRLNMDRTIQQKNKDLVLEAFDTRFNKRDYARAETFWSPKYIQHSAHIEPGPRSTIQPRQEHSIDPEVRTGTDRCRRRLCNRVGRFSGMGLPVNWIAADILRIENGILVEHWDVIWDEATEEQSKSKAPMFGSSFPVYSKPERTLG